MKPSNNKRRKTFNQDYDHPFTKNDKCLINNNTSYISTQSLTYKRNKIDHDDYDDYSCDIRIMNDFLNEDCLMKLFTYLSTCDRPKIALVCKKWNYALNRTWSNVKRIKLSYWAFDDCQNFFQRNPTIGGGFKFLSSLLGDSLPRCLGTNFPIKCTSTS
ncbi:uncharacterized protein LOC122851421 isoform X2 [Aphidius gifuensis]|uniref:uncharacterized protein LOC122851421 isoform X2 n=1 Tax=Aphidius gifuensis TaxID=684658 RepID=UPI001CDD46FD|nr:uncharacterized protein LOC122851421 isoform X2 [Aphidius gifuensis]